ncbi:MAG TPA: hypothetical protein VGM32_24565, partial [Rhodopila sp.]
MEVSVRHWIPGRVRLHIPALSSTPRGNAKIVRWLVAQEGILDARINHGCASLVISYQESCRPLLESMLDYMRCVTPRDLIALLAQTKLPDSLPPQPPVRHPAPAATLGPSVLALPTVSLVLAFSTSPLAVAANVPLMVWNAWPIATRAWGVWQRERRLNVDFLDTLAITASIGQGLMVTGGIITWLIRLGDWIRDLTARGSKRAIADLMEFQSRTAWLLVEGRVMSVPAIQVTTGDLVVVYPGEMIPVDGEVVEGDAMVDQKTITGEGLPVARGRGEMVFAATGLREGQITVRAVRVGIDTVAGQIAKLVDAAPIGDTRIQNHAERFADRLVVPTLGLAVGTAAVTADFQRFLSLVIIDYGTGIRVAAPTSVLASMTQAARSGIIIKSGS